MGRHKAEATAAGSTDDSDLPHLVFSDGRAQHVRLSDLLGERRTKPNVDVYAALVDRRLPLDPHATVHEGVGVRLAAPPPTPTASDIRTDPVRGLRAVLEDAVARSMAGATRVAVMTGGGVDSGILLALAVHVGRRLGKEVFAIALDYDAPGDDRPYLAELERHLRCEVIRVAPEEGADHVGILDGVDASPSFVPTAAMEAAVAARAKRAGAKRILSGTGGDQVFDGKPTSLANVARRSSLIEAIRRARRLRGFDRVEPYRWVVRPLLVDLVPVWIRARRAEHGRVHPSWAGPAYKAFDARRRRQYRARLAATLPNPEPFEREMFEGQRMQVEAFSHHLNVWSDTVRVSPYLDDAVLRAVRSVPPETLIRDDIRRGFLRAAAADLIPASLRRRTDKAVFGPALVRFLRAANAARLLEPYAGVERLASLGLVVPRRFAPIVESFIERPPERGAWGPVWSPLALERFLRRR